jgi:Tfp pilus assembly protein PilW
MMRNRPGYSLTELLVGLVIASLIGASVIRLMTVQSQFFNRQEGRANARATSRSATNIMISELRLVEPLTGVLAATDKSISVRVPFAVGLICATNGTNTTVALTPMDSVVYGDGIAGSLVDGYGWRNTDTAPFTINGGTISIGAGSTATCTAAGITPVSGSQVITVAPPATGSLVASPMYLYQRITYSLTNSVSVPGEVGLWRTVVNRSVTEEIVAPFDTSAHFRFFVNGSNTSQTAVPSPVTDMRGIELRLTARNERTTSRVAAELTPLTTAVFFKNQ